MSIALAKRKKILRYASLSRRANAPVFASLHCQSATRKKRARFQRHVPKKSPSHISQLAAIAFKTNRGFLEKHYLDKFALMSGSRFEGAYETLEEAVSDGYKRLFRVGFKVFHIGPDPEPTIISRII